MLTLLQSTYRYSCQQTLAAQRRSILQGRFNDQEHATPQFVHHSTSQQPLTISRSHTHNNAIVNAVHALPYPTHYPLQAATLAVQPSSLSCPHSPPLTATTGGCQPCRLQPTATAAALPVGSADTPRHTSRPKSCISCRGLEGAHAVVAAAAVHVLPRLSAFGQSLQTPQQQQQMRMVRRATSRGTLWQNTCGPQHIHTPTGKLRAQPSSFCTQAGSTGSS
jgi:hypothetical protein